MIANPNYALYYPSIEFGDPEWLWTASLLWDRIYRIVPDGFEPRDPPNVSELCAAGEIGARLTPGAYAKTIADEFSTKVKTHAWHAGALERVERLGEAKMHQDQVDARLRAMLIATGAAKPDGEWLHVPAEFEAIYMTYLAEKMAQKSNLALLTDSSAAWTGLTFFQHPAVETEYDPSDSRFVLASLVIREICPVNLMAITPDELLRFREKRKTERGRFLSAIAAAAKRLANCHDATVVADLLQEIKTEITVSVSEYRRSMDLLQATGWMGWKTVTLPISASLFGPLFAAPAAKAALAGTGLALGVIAGIADVQTKGRRLSRESEFSYLVHLQDSFGRKHVPPEFELQLRRQLNELVND